MCRLIKKVIAILIENFSFLYSQRKIEQKSVNASSTSSDTVGICQKLKKKEIQLAKDSESKKREDLTSLGSDDSGLLKKTFLSLDVLVINVILF